MPESTDWAASGVVALTGSPGGPPLVPPGRAATRARELTDRIAAATADTAHPVRLDGARLLAERAALTGHRRGGRVSAGGSCRLLPTLDGWAAVSCARPGDPLLLGALVGEELTGDPWPVVAAWVGAHPGEELAARAELLGVAAGPVRPPEVAPPPLPRLPARPVAGLLVVDFSALWAGPLAASLLGLAGARVVKVEVPDRPDGARRGDPAFYRLLHAGHRSVQLDPATLRGRAALRALVAAADVVVEASRPRALAGFGLDAGAAVAAGTTWISLTAAGRASNRVGFGDDVAAAAGLVARDAGGDPVFAGDALADPLTGLTAAALAMTAPADGSGVLWDVAMADVVAATLTGAEPGPSPAARREDGRWVVDTPDGAVPVEPPRPRPASGTPAGTAPEPGADTAAVLAELGIPAP
ncbi:CoA transferase [Trujillonella humicola]|uniref:CoA transferase n=1 Tax=Trujillonella humicola TaxID=3383699 RepID=UPI003905D191